jgi:hypothetical protein
VAMDSGLAAAQRPGMTTVVVSKNARRHLRRRAVVARKDDLAPVLDAVPARFV